MKTIALAFSLFILLFTSALHAQETYTDNVAGFSVSIPEGWSTEKFETGELAMRATNADGTAFYDINLRKLEEGQTTYDYLVYLEGFMADAGYSENFVDADKRSFSGEDAAPYNADDLACGVYTREKNGIMMMQTIIIFRSGVYAYMTITTNPSSDAEALSSAHNIFNTTFKILE